MTNRVFVSKAFKREAKKLLKKYELMKNPFIGTSYGTDIYKIRLADKSKGRGKSGSFRVMYFHIYKTEAGIDIILMSIYDKSEKSTILKVDAIKKLKDILTEESF
jgi:mRNA-degrading endonuclease RelE of RelBE toxin-antitoxin system